METVIVSRKEDLVFPMSGRVRYRCGNAVVEAEAVWKDGNRQVRLRNGSGALRVCGGDGDAVVAAARMLGLGRT